MSQKKSCLVKKTTKQNNYHTYSQRNPKNKKKNWEWQRAQERKRKKIIGRGNVPRKGKEEKKKMAEATCLGKKKLAEAMCKCTWLIFVH